MERLEDTGRHVVHELERFLNTLGTIAGVSPLLGLLGTVTGIIKAFNAINAGGMGDPRMLSGGIAEALVTTAAGLCVAIPVADRLPLPARPGRPHRRRDGKGRDAARRRARVDGTPRRHRGGPDMNLRPRRTEEPEINLISLIDVLLMLVIFFMLSSTFAARGGCASTCRRPASVPLSAAAPPSRSWSPSPQAAATGSTSANWSTPAPIRCAPPSLKVGAAPTATSR